MLVLDGGDVRHLRREDDLLTEARADGGSDTEGWRPGRFVDAHMHLWDLGRLRYPWLSPPFAPGPNGITEPIASDYGLAQYRAESAGWNVVGCVHVEAGAHPDDAHAETRWLAELAKADGWPSAVVARASLDDPDLDEALERQAAFPIVRGIRDIANWHADPGLTYNAHDKLIDPRWRSGYERLARHGFSFDMQLFPSQMEDAASLARRNPATAMIVDHAGMPDGRDEDAIRRWRRGVGMLADCPNVAMKLSGLGFADRDWTVESFRPFILHLVERFGCERCMMASNFPTDRLYGSFESHLGAYVEIVRDFSDAERDALFAGTASRLYRLG